MSTPHDNDRIARLPWLPRFLRPAHPITVGNEKLLLLVGIANLIADYDVTLYGMAMEQIQADLKIPEDQLTTIGAIFRTGMIPALFLAYLSDVIGRRLLLMVTLTGAAIATVATSFATTVNEFIIAQTIARTFIYCEELLCIVIIAESFPERTRGWAIGALGALAALGAGLAAAVFALIDLLPFGWRAMYLIGALPLLWLIWARRNLPETARFKEGRTPEVSLGARFLRPAIGLLTHYPLRMCMLILTLGPYVFGMASAIFLISKFLQSAHGWQPWQVSVLIIGGGIIAVVGNFAAGLASDRFGRRTILALAIILASGNFWLFYAVAEGVWLAPVWIVGIFASFAAGSIFQALGAELFPTSYRSVASGIRLLATLLIGAIALIVEGSLYNSMGSHSAAVSTLLMVSPLSLIALFFLPETATRTLEDIAPERKGPAAK